MKEIIIGLTIPFIGTLLGSACVFFLKKEIKPKMQKLLLGFASGVMIAASVWSLLIPSIDMSSDMGKWSFVPALTGLALGVGFLLLLDKIIPHLHANSDKPEGIKVQAKQSTMLILAVTLHNIPEGMAVGAVFAGFITGEATISFAGALALAIGIAVQNFPEGAVISLPLLGKGLSKPKAFLYGTLSGIVEPIGAALTVLLASFVIPIMPYLLSFAAGAMIYVVVEELLPEASEGEHSNISSIGFAVGFAVMMVLDVALG